MATDLVISPSQFLTHWQGHCGLTRKIIADFPDDQLFTFSLGGLRSSAPSPMKCSGWRFHAQDVVDVK